MCACPHALSKITSKAYVKWPSLKFKMHKTNIRKYQNASTTLMWQHSIHIIWYNFKFTITYCIFPLNPYLIQLIVIWILLNQCLAQSYLTHVIWILCWIQNFSRDTSVLYRKSIIQTVVDMYLRHFYEAGCAIPILQKQNEINYSLQWQKCPFRMPKLKNIWLFR